MLRAIRKFLAALMALVTLAASMSVFFLGAAAWGAMVGRKQAWSRFMDMEIPQNKLFEAVFPPQWRGDEDEAPAKRVFRPGSREFVEFQRVPNRHRLADV